MLAYLLVESRSGATGPLGEGFDVQHVLQLGLLVPISTWPSWDATGAAEAMLSMLLFLLLFVPPFVSFHSAASALATSDMMRLERLHNEFDYFLCVHNGQLRL